MKPESHLAMSVLAICVGFACLFTITNAMYIDGYSVKQILDCQKILKLHQNYSTAIEPISARYAQPRLHNFPNWDQATEEPESLSDIERKEEIKVRLTMQVFYGEIKEWMELILPCTRGIVYRCFNKTMQNEFHDQELRVISLLTYYDLTTHSYARVNTTEVYEKIAQNKKMLASMETTQMDLCPSGDYKCQDCLEDRADQLIADNQCNSFRQWHIIKYAPIANNPCKDMKHIYVPPAFENW